MKTHKSSYIKKNLAASSKNRYLMNIDTNIDFKTMLTETRNPNTDDIDKVSTLEIVRMMNEEDRIVPDAVSIELPKIARAIDKIAERMRQGGRLIYIGAGTSGRLGILDAAECPPTFNTHPEQVIALIAGGKEAIYHAVEGAEDQWNVCSMELERINLSELDSVVGIAASGRTPYVLDGLFTARQVGALTVSIACNHPSPMEQLTEISITPVVGPEVITGSTRLKAGTAQKLVLNMISTGVMIRLGKTYGNLMADMQANNYKLKERAVNLVSIACNVSEEEAERLLELGGGDVKTTILSHLLHIDALKAEILLKETNGVINKAVESFKKSNQEDNK